MFHAHFFRAFFVCFSMAVLLSALGCGGGGSSGPGTTTPPPTSKTATQFKIGDAAADRIISFEVSITSPITVTTSTGNFQITLGSNRLELSHMSAKMEPLTIVNAPQGTYTAASLTINNPEVTFLDNNGVAHSIQAMRHRS
jgi:hypothetical protein